MRTYALNHLSDVALLRGLDALVAQERACTASVLAHIAEVDARRLYLPAGFPSMHAYCVGKLRFSEDAAYKRIQAARVCRQSPAIFAALSEGRLHLTGLGLLAPYLRASNATELLEMAGYKTKTEIEQLIAQRFPRTDVLALEQVIRAPASSHTEDPSLPVASTGAATSQSLSQLAPAQVLSNAAEQRNADAKPESTQYEAPVTRPRVTSLSASSFAVQFTIGKNTQEMLRYVRSLLSHRLPSGDLAQIFDKALHALAKQLEKERFAETSRPRSGSSKATSKRCIPAHVKREVWRRDQGRCTFVSESGQRCESTEFIEFDHVDPVARGGVATVASVRLRCRGHNQYEAERVFGAGFMHEKRERGRRAIAAQGSPRSRIAPPGP